MKYLDHNWMRRETFAGSEGYTWRGYMSLYVWDVQFSNVSRSAVADFPHV